MTPFTRQIIAVVAVGTFFGTVSTTQAVTENPYRDIVARNAFALQPPPPPPTNAPPPVVEAPSNISMTGVSAMSGRKIVYLTLTTPGEKEPKYLRLGENERDGAIEVTHIDIKSGKVNIKNRGASSVISFETHGAKNNYTTAVPNPNLPKPGVPGVPGVPGAVPAPGQAVTTPTAVPTSLPVNSNNTGTGQRPTGTVPTTTEPATRTIPQRPMRITPNSSGGGASINTPAPVVNPVVQAVQIEVNRNTQPANFPPLPPTALSSN